MVVLGGWLDFTILEVFSNLNDSVILSFCGCECMPGERARYTVDICDRRELLTMPCRAPRSGEDSREIGIK